MKLPFCVILLAIAMICISAGTGGEAKRNSFGEDVAFLDGNVGVVILSDTSGQAQVAVVPLYQGRVMTSTAGGSGGISFGWINYEFIASGKKSLHINVYGGEDRFWMGPEGGQFSIFFAKGVPFDLEHWFTPAPLDTEPFEVIEKDRDRVRLSKKMQLTNYSHMKFDVEVTRDIRLLNPSEIWEKLGVSPVSGVRMVAYETENRITNMGKRAWRKETGLLSIWILGMFNPSPSTTIVTPFKQGLGSSLGPIVNDAYFGKVPPDRLAVKGGVVFFSGDGRYRSKIGISPRRAKPVLGSYDASDKVLNLVEFTLPRGAMDYVNSMWELQKQPYSGDAANAYNDGPPAPGAKPLGPFYELESSSPAAALKPGESLTHLHRTIHFQGAEEPLDSIARAKLGVSLGDIKSAFRK